MGRRGVTTESAKATRTSKRKAESDSIKEDTVAEKSNDDSTWGFMKAPSGDLLKKQKKATKNAQVVDFPTISKEEMDQFNDTIPLKENDDTYRILSWNVNGIRAVLKKENYFRAYIAREDPDILCISETKIDDASLATVKQVLPQYPYQYWRCAEQKGYSGTAVFSKTEPLNVETSIVVDGEEDTEGRFISLEFKEFWLVHTYVPNAGQKLERLTYRTEEWDKSMFKKLKEFEKIKPVIWCGDLNVAHQDIDIHDPKGNKNKSAGFTDAERNSFSSLLNDGFIDTYRQLNPTKQEYTYFSYRFGAREKNKGWRLDYFIVSESIFSKIENSYIRSTITGSDHLPIGLIVKKN